MVGKLLCLHFNSAYFFDELVLQLSQPLLLVLDLFKIYFMWIHDLVTNFSELWFLLLKGFPLELNLFRGELIKFPLLENL